MKIRSDSMKIAIDKIEKLDKLKDNEIVYVFDKENIDELLNTGLHCIHKDYIENVDINLTKYNIPCLKKCKINDDFTLPGKMDHKFAIIIPNYNYAEWLEKCLNSVLSQTYKNYEIIFVDDMSTDNSVGIAENLLKSPHKIIKLKQKRLNGGARNEAYLHISDDVDYICYLDSDDWLANNTVLEEINAALKYNHDVLFIGMLKYMDNIEKIVSIPKYKNRYEAMQGWSGSCGKVVRKELATRQDCLYNEGTLKEDRNQHYRICIHMDNFICLEKGLYVWNKQNTKSVTTIRDDILWNTSTIRHYADTLQLYLAEKGKDKIIDDLLEKRVEKTKKEIENGGDAQW